MYKNMNKSNVDFMYHKSNATKIWTKLYYWQMAICKSSLSGICTQYIYRTQSRVVCAKPRRFSFFCVVIHQMVADCIVRQRIRGHSDMPPLRKQECGRVKARLTVRQKTGAAPKKSLPYRRSTYIWFILCRKKGYKARSLLL